MFFPAFAEAGSRLWRCLREPIITFADTALRWELNGGNHGDGDGDNGGNRGVSAGDNGGKNKTFVGIAVKRVREEMEGNFKEIGVE